MKLDLHTHCHEAVSFADPDIELVRKIVLAVKGRGLDGIAITEHDTSDFAYEVKELVECFFGGEILIIPGQEVREDHHQIVELYLSNNLTFRFVAHPGYISDTYYLLDDIHGLEIENAHYHIDKQKVKKVARRHRLLLLSNSDAHSLSEIGKYYNEIDVRALEHHIKYR